MSPRICGLSEPAVGILDVPGRGYVFFIKLEQNMSFQEFINNGWNDHVEDSSGVAGRLGDGVGMMKSEADLGSLVGLSLHVWGEHLGEWDRGLSFFNSLLSHKHVVKNENNQRMVQRSIAILQLAKGDSSAAEESGKLSIDPNFSKDSGWVRIYAAVAGALAGQKNIESAHEYFSKAFELASYGPAKSDPAARSLAITGNNLAVSLEEQEKRSTEETELMLLAATTARKYWEVAGSWVETERAEYRLAISYIKAEKYEQGLAHADACLKINTDQQAGLFEHFFGHEARTRCLRGLGQTEEAEKALANAKSALADVEWSLGYMKETFAKL